MECVVPISFSRLFGTSGRRAIDSIVPRRTFDDVILPPSTRRALDNALAQVTQHDLIFRRWGLGERHSTGLALAFNFAGPPGTGKTICAEAIAHSLGRHLLMVRYAELESMWMGETPKNVAAIIAFAPGRGGHANDFPNRVCAPHTLMAAAGEFGKAARVKVTWLVAANDSYFSPTFSRQLVDAFRGAGGKPDFHVLPAHGSEGHWLVETEGGVKLARSELDRALKGRSATSAKKR